MKIFPPFSDFSIKQFSIIFSSLLAGSLAWILHFTLEFSVIVRLDLPIILVFFHYIGVPIGGIVTIKFLSKFKNIIGYTGSFSLMIFFFICLIVIEQSWFVPIGLFGAGFCLGNLFTYAILFSNFAFSDPKFNCRLMSINLGLISFLLLFETLIIFTEISLLHVTFFLIIFILFFIFLLYGKGEISIPTQKHLNISLYIKKKKDLPELINMFFWGFFFVITYYSTILILNLYGLQDLFNIFIVLFLISFAIFSFPSGLIADILGRRFTLLIGFLIQALAFLLLSFLIQIDISLFFIFPLLLGPGFCLIINTGIVITVELSSSEHLRDKLAFSISIMAIGCVAGGSLAEISRPLILIDPAYLTLLLLFVFVVATIVVFKLRETLPPKAELYVKPEKLSEEEITLFRERKICVVCKGNVSRFNTYICPDCGVLYCVKCAKALSNLENLCWVCNTPFDESKPVKISEEEEEEEIKKDEIKPKVTKSKDK